MPSIDALSAELVEQGLTVLLVNVGEEHAIVAQAVKERRYTATVVLDPDGGATRAYRVHATPTVFLVGRDFNVVGRATGRRPWTEPAGRALLGGLLAATTR